MRTEYGDEVNVCAGVLLIAGAVFAVVLLVARLSGCGVNAGAGTGYGAEADVAGEVR